MGAWNPLVKFHIPGDEIYREVLLISGFNFEERLCLFLEELLASFSSFCSKFGDFLDNESCW